jgi:hypothetical protein
MTTGASITGYDPPCLMLVHSEPGLLNHRSKSLAAMGDGYGNPL